MAGAIGNGALGEEVEKTEIVSKRKRSLVKSLDTQEKKGQKPQDLLRQARGSREAGDEPGGAEAVHQPGEAAGDQSGGGAVYQPCGAGQAEAVHGGAGAGVQQQEPGADHQDSRQGLVSTLPKVQPPGQQRITGCF